MDGRKQFWSFQMVFAIDLKRFLMRKNPFESFAYYLLSILGVFGWTKTLLKTSDRICYSFWAFSDERKHFWSIRILFVIAFRRFRMDENNFEVFRWYLLSILSVFGWTKTIFKFSDRICYSFWAYSDERKHFWSLRIRFAIDIKRFRIDENTFEGFRSYLLLILSVF